jgi:anti-anti-sigma factor
MADFDATVRGRSGTAVIDLNGDLDGRAASAIADARSEAHALGPQAIVLNFADVGYINSTGIALIVGLLAEARAANVGVHAIGLSDHYRHIFEITRLADLVTFFGSEEEAVGDGMTAPA